jgi:uncharacterized protein (TIGR00730 family)
VNRVCVYAGSSPGASPAFAAAARSLADALARREIGIVYGGGSVGLMGELADAGLAEGVEVIGVIPETLDRREVAHRGVTRLEVVATMHERKARMAELADAFVALPGGIGTLEELIEVLTWTQLGVHLKPVGVLDVDGYWTPLRTLLDHAVEQRFLRPEHRGDLIVHDDPEALLDALEAWQPAPRDKWIDREQS